MRNQIILTSEQIANLVQMAGLELNPIDAVSEDISKAIIAIEQKLGQCDYSLNFLNSENDILNVLIIDDMELSIHQLTAMLKKVGANVFVARSKDEAITEMRKKNFHYVITDLFMPDANDGLEIIKDAVRIKEKMDKEFKLVAISGTDDKELIQRCYELGIDEFVSKQIDWHQKILKFISSTLNKTGNEEYHKYSVNGDTCVLSVYKINNQKYVDKILKEVNSSVLTGNKNIILNMEYIKIFSDAYSNIFAEIYKSTSAQGGLFVLVRPSEDVIKALDYVFLTNAINIFDKIEDAVQYIELQKAH